MRIAMWSGPRNLSTAMMYAFGNRPDFAVWDEPFYAAYLKTTGLNHPMREEIIAADESDAAKVAARCIGPIPGGLPHFYLKVMPHHMVAGFPVDWAKDCVNIHLIRHPARVIASYAAKRETVTAADLGFAQQAAMFDRLGGLVIDSADIRDDPQEMLHLMCDAIGLTFDPAMLSWPSGGHPSDGVWAPHWYGAVHASTGFAGPEGPLPALTGSEAELLDQAMPHYERLAREKI